MAKSPIKFGLGEYSDKPFELKSGNNASFKMMGSPVNNVDDTTTEDGKGGGWKKALGLVGSMLTSGLDAVYGTGKVSMSGRLLKDKSDDKTKSFSELLAERGYEEDKEGNIIKKSS